MIEAVWEAYMKMQWNKYENEKGRDNILNRLIKDNVPVVIYGPGKFGRAVAECIINNNIQILCFLDKEEYWTPGKSLMICEKEIICLTRKQLMEMSGTYNMLLGMNDYSQLKDLKREFKDCHYVEYLDVYPSHIMPKSFLTENSKILNEIYLNLYDSESREVLEAYLYARYTGDVECLSNLMHDSKYLYDWDLLALSREDVVIDGGAFIGDSIIEIKDYLGVIPHKVYAFEPDINNAEKISSHFSDEELENIVVVNAGLYSNDRTIHFDTSGTLGSAISEQAEDVVLVHSLDMHKEYSDATVIKMDIEGSELEALRGSEKLIREKKPRLAICIYHRNEDLIQIYEFLKQFEYRFFMRQHSTSVEETVLYAV